MSARLRVGSRRSPLARAQTDLVVRELRRRARRAAFEVVPLDTSGDRDRRAGTSPDFTDAIDRALRAGEIDLAVHSAKDLPVRLDRHLRIAATPRRADPRDALVAEGSARPGALRPHARIGSSSARRRAQLLRWRPDLEVVEIRGNVDTRIGYVRRRALDGVVVALAGLRRLGRAREASRILPLSGFLPAPAQGALAIVVRADDPRTAALAALGDDPSTHARVVAERAVVEALGADCTVPLAALAHVKSARLEVRAEVLSPDGRRSAAGRAVGPRAEAAELGRSLGDRLRRAGARGLWEP